MSVDSKTGSPRLVLASASPRRVELLRDAGFAFDVDPADVDEEADVADLDPANVALHLAQRKAARVAARHPGDVVVLGADTVVDCDERRLGKAETPEAAREMIRFQAGRSSTVWTGVAICYGETRIVDLVATTVAMRPMTDADIDAYVATDLWRGKAGAYGVQDAADDPIVLVVFGSYSNVVGLPIERVVEMLAEVGVVPTRGTR